MCGVECLEIHPQLTSRHQRDVCVFVCLFCEKGYSSVEWNLHGMLRDLGHILTMENRKQNKTKINVVNYKYSRYKVKFQGLKPTK